MQRRRRRARLDAKLGHEHSATGEILAQGVAASTGTGKGEDQPLVCGLVERLELDQPACDIDRGGELTCARMGVGERREHLGVAVDQSLTPRSRPVAVALFGQGLSAPHRSSSMERRAAEGPSFASAPPAARSNS